AELRRDDNGSWGKPAGNSRYYKIDPDTGDAVRVDRCCKLIEGAEYDVQILSKRYEHPLVNGRFVRKIYTGRSPMNSLRMYEPCMTLAVLTYYWKGEPEYFEVGPQRRVRIADAAERSRLEVQYPLQSSQPCFTDRTRAPSPPTKRTLTLESTKKNPEAAFSQLCIELSTSCRFWVGGASHDDDTIAHEEEIIIEDGNFNEDYPNIS
ncbi:hypothetical protein OSTOST_09521, partial [Ostertagia ostertagi]